MNIYLDNQAEFYLKINKIPDNSAGIFYSIKDSSYIWWKNNHKGFDCGEEDNFTKSFNKLRC
jgi:hypothetical protein